ncbi:MAG: hypothetical protein ACTSR7_18450 [Promethearchaeota archaeon]
MERSLPAIKPKASYQRMKKYIKQSFKILENMKIKEAKRLSKEN